MSFHPRILLFLGIALAAGGCGLFGDENEPPTIETINVQPANPPPNGQATLTAETSDPEGDSLRFAWRASGGAFQEGTDTQNPASWLAPAETGEYEITCTVSDHSASESTTVTVEVGFQQR